MREAGPAILLSHLVVASNFTMTLAPHKQRCRVFVYQLTNSALVQITVVVREAMQSEDPEDDNGPSEASDDGGDFNTDSSKEGDSDSDD